MTSRSFPRRLHAALCLFWYCRFPMRFNTFDRCLISKCIRTSSFQENYLRKSNWWSCGTSLDGFRLCSSKSAVQTTTRVMPTAPNTTQVFLQTMDLNCSKLIQSCTFGHVGNCLLWFWLRSRNCIVDKQKKITGSPHWLLKRWFKVPRRQKFIHFLDVLSIIMPARFDCTIRQQYHTCGRSNEWKNVYPLEHSIPRPWSETDKSKSLPDTTLCRQLISSLLDLAYIALLNIGISGLYLSLFMYRLTEMICKKAKYLKTLLRSLRRM